MTKLNTLQYGSVEEFSSLSHFSLNALRANDAFDAYTLEYKTLYNYKKIKTFSFSKEGFLALFLELDGDIAVSKGESEALIEGARFYEKVGGEVLWLELTQEGQVDFTPLQTKSVAFAFVSSYVMDTFAKTELKELKQYKKMKIISNASAHFDAQSDIIYFDNYKLTGFNSSGVLLFNEEEFELLSIGMIDSIAVKICLDALKVQQFNLKLKNIFLQKLQEELGDDIFFFVKPSLTLEYTLHFGLKKLKARELIRTLALSKIYISNGEGCSLGLSRPSRIIQEMGYSELKSREALCLNFSEMLSEEKIKKIIKIIVTKYKQIRLLNDD